MLLKQVPAAQAIDQHSRGGMGTGSLLKIQGAAEEN